jgi:hypothetical protein
MTPSQNMLNDAHDDVRHHSILTSWAPERSRWKTFRKANLKST